MLGTWKPGFQLNDIAMFARVWLTQVKRTELVEMFKVVDSDDTDEDGVKFFPAKCFSALTRYLFERPTKPMPPFNTAKDVPLRKRTSAHVNTRFGQVANHAKCGLPSITSSGYAYFVAEKKAPEARGAAAQEDSDSGGGDDDEEEAELEDQKETS